MGYIKREPRFGAAIGRVIGHRYDGGGKISQQKPEVRGVTEFNTGGSHEENKYGGVPQGVAPDGAPNLVEEGEVKLKDIIGVDNQYILSNRIMLDAEHAEEYGIPQSVVGMTYAAAFKKLFRPLKERSGNIEVKNEIAHLANAFMEAQDSVKAEQEARQMGDMMQAMPPEALAQMAQAAQGQQAQQPMPPQGVPPEAMGQGMQPGMGQEMPPQPGIEGQGMPPEMMQGAPQGMPPEAMQGGVDPSMTQQAGGIPMMARGGRMRTFAKGGKITTNRNNMFQGIFEHRYDEGGEVETGKKGKKTRKVNSVSRRLANWMDNPEGVPSFLKSAVRAGFAINPIAQHLHSYFDNMADAQDLAYGDSDEEERSESDSELPDASEVARKYYESHKDEFNKTNNQLLSEIKENADTTQVSPENKENSSDSEKDSDEPADDNNGITDVGEPSEVDQANAGANGSPAPSALKDSTSKNENQNADLDDLVRRTIRGEFGNGADRKKKLGDKYKEVLSGVNKWYAERKKKDESKANSKADGVKPQQASASENATPSSGNSKDVASKPQKINDYLNDMSDKELDSLLAHITALKKSRSLGGRPSDTDEMDKILAATAGPDEY